MPYYLKCRYADGIYDDEYLVSFDAKEKKNRCFVRRSDVITEKDNSGLVRIILSSYGMNMSVIKIIEAHSFVVQRFFVKTDDIVLKEE